jgi:hypothetical protein
VNTRLRGHEGPLSGESSPWSTGGISTAHQTFQSAAFNSICIVLDRNGGCILFVLQRDQQVPAGVELGILHQERARGREQEPILAAERDEQLVLDLVRGVVQVLVWRAAKLLLDAFEAVL